MANEWNGGDLENAGHTHTLVNLSAMRNRKNANDSLLNENGEPAPIKTKEYGRTKVKIGSGEQIVNLAPEARANEPESQCIVKGYHPDSAISYLTTQEALDKCALWDKQSEEL